jgi:tetratricopeptide (TPR) repeat protein
VTRVREIDALIRREQLVRAREALEQALSAIADDAAQAWRLRLRTAERLLHDAEQPVDHAIFLLEDLLASPAPDALVCEEDLPRVWAGLIRAFTAKRCLALAREVTEQARAALGQTEATLLAEGDCALEFDQRPAARQRYEEALALSPAAGAPRQRLANLLYVLGDFDGCHAQLEAVASDDAAWPRAVRLRASALAAVHDYGGEAVQWRRVVEALPDGDHVGRDRISLGLALAAAGDQPGALSELRTAWRAEPEAPQGRYARERIEYLERAGVQEGGATAPVEPVGRRRRLQAFPTTQQKWNYCGPAVLELCLRYLDIDLGQDEIAAAIKRAAGTPMYEIAQYLRERDVAARRIEATPERLKAAIDLGLPVIVQEEYSTTSHVAVIIGYDEALGLFVASDPMTHRQLLRPFSWTEHAGAMFGNGGLVVLGREGAALAPLEARADEAGLIEARHLSILDTCDRRRPRPGAGGEAEDAALQQVIQLCEEALRLSPDFRLAWYRQWHAENHLFQLSAQPEAREQVLARLHHIRTTFPDDEWPHQIHGQWLLDSGRFEEAFVAYFEASRRDTLDANNLQAMGECKWLAGDLAAAERHLLEALALEPFHLRAAENLAGVYLRQLEQLDHGASEDLARMVPREVTTAIERQEADLARRAAHFSAVACSLAPDNPFNHEIGAALRCRAGDLAAGIAAFRRSLAIIRERPYSLWGLARALEADGQLEEAGALLAEGAELFWRDPASWRAWSAFLVRQGEQGAAAEILGHGLETLAEGHARLVRPYHEALSASGSPEAASSSLRRLAERRPGDEELLREVAYLLDEHDQRRHAVVLLRHVVDRAPHDVSALFRLGNLLSEDLTTRGEGRALLERVVELAPDAAAPRRQLALLHLEQDPERGLALLEPVQQQQDPFVNEARAVLLEALGRDEEAAHAFGQALDAFGVAGAGLLELCAWHLEAHRYGRALVLARRFYEPGADLPDDLYDPARFYWIRAHRQAGAVGEVLPRLRELCAGELEEDLAWEVYWASRSFDHALAARAAEAYAVQTDDPGERLEWQIHAATEREHLGESGVLEQLRDALGDAAIRWAELSWAYIDLGRHDEADAAARRAFELDPEDQSALAVMGEAHVRAGDVEAALGCARRLVELFPDEHQGPERLGILQAKLGDVEPALKNSELAVDAAPDCHVAHRGRALALFAAGDHDQALRHACQALALEPPDDEADDALMIKLALEGDLAGVQRCLDALANEEPPEVFAGFKASLLQVAKTH